MNPSKKAMPVVLLTMLALAGCARLPSLGDKPTLSVTGVGRSQVAPDIVVVTLGVQTRGARVGPAVEENNRLTQQVMDALRARGVAAEDMRTSYFNVWTQPRYDEFGNPTEDVTYWVDNSITVTLRDIDQLGGLLQEALNQGANSVQGVTYSVEDPSAALDEAREEAMDDARRKALQLAAAAEGQLGPVLSIAEATFAPGPVVGFAYGIGGEVGAAPAEVPTTPGTLEYQVQVTVVYRIR